MKLSRARDLMPEWKNALLAVLAAVLLILAFPDFEFWFLAWFALVPLLLAIERQKHCVSVCFTLGWIFGVVFFFGTCWWLTFAPITYAGFPPLLAYFLLFCVTAVAAIFPGIFGLVLSLFLRRFGMWSFLLAPFVWVFTEFLRYWLTGNNWNAIGYSQAFNGVFLYWPSLAGFLATSWIVVSINSVFFWFFRHLFQKRELNLVRAALFAFLLTAVPTLVIILFSYDYWVPRTRESSLNIDGNLLLAIQPDVPMSGLTQTKWDEYRRNHVRLAETELQKLTTEHRPPTTVVFPESPMNFMYGDEPETKKFINDFAARKNVSVLFNSAEPNKADNKYFNSAVLVGPEGKMIGQYDKIYLLPFGEAVPTPLQSILPAFVGSFSYGSEYDLLPIGDAKAGVMICFESHFGELSREYVRNGADVIIEMTNDGYLGPTPVLRQHLANAVFRAVETNRPVLRVTNVGVTAYINERGEVLDAAEPYTEATRIWSVSKSDGSQTFYVKYGDWFAWLCSIITIGSVILSIRNRKESFSN
jgi:apolipoprotein N-acyltransferase